MLCQSPVLCYKYLIFHTALSGALIHLITQILQRDQCWFYPVRFSALSKVLQDEKFLSKENVHRQVIVAFHWPTYKMHILVADNYHTHNRQNYLKTYEYILIQQQLLCHQIKTVTINTDWIIKCWSLLKSCGWTLLTDSCKNKKKGHECSQLMF